MTIYFSPSALLDLKNIKEFYIQQSVPQIGFKQVESILKDIEALSSHPQMGRVVPEFNNEMIRELIRPPFRIIYLVELQSIKIIRIWRSERQLSLNEFGG